MPSSLEDEIAMRSHLFRFLAVFLIVAFSRVEVIARETVEESVRRWPPGKRIEVVLAGKQGKFVGRLGAVGQEGFVLNPEKNLGSPRTFNFVEVEEVRSKMSTSRKWTIAAIFIGIDLGLGLILGN